MAEKLCLKMGGGIDVASITEVGVLSHVSSTLHALIANMTTTKYNANGNNTISGTAISIVKVTTVNALAAGQFAVSADGAPFVVNTYAAGDRIYYKSSGTKRCIVLYLG